MQFLFVAAIQRLIWEQRNEWTKWERMSVREREIMLPHVTCHSKWLLCESTPRARREVDWKNVNANWVHMKVNARIYIYICFTMMAEGIKGGFITDLMDSHDEWVHLNYGFERKCDETATHVTTAKKKMEKEKKYETLEWKNERKKRNKMFRLPTFYCQNKCFVNMFASLIFTQFNIIFGNGNIYLFLFVLSPVVVSFVFCFVILHFHKASMWGLLRMEMMLSNSYWHNQITNCQWQIVCGVHWLALFSLALFLPYWYLALLL